MATLTIKNLQGADAGTVDVQDSLFGIEPNVHAVRQALLAYEANQRLGTHSTKTRAHVRGGGKKPWRQKGTGRARQGSIRAPQWRGGAIIFGPLPRDYRQKVNRKVRRLALASALSDLRAQGRIHVAPLAEFQQAKTKEFKVLLSRLGLSEARNVLVLLPESSEALILAARNLPQVDILVATAVNIHSLLTADAILTSPDALKKLEEVLG